MPDTPEQRARHKIDRLLEQCGWIVQDLAGMNITAGRGVAVREFPLKRDSDDYLLYADGKAIGVVQAKPEGHTDSVLNPRVGLIRAATVWEWNSLNTAPLRSRLGSQRRAESNCDRYKCA